MNILTLYLDDMRHDGLAFMPKTRALLRTEFTQARANGGACTDARLSLHTGTATARFPWPWPETPSRHDAARCWQTWLRAAGYTTALFGKYIAVGSWPVDGPPGAVAPGWDHWRGYDDTSTTHEEHGFTVFDGTEQLRPETSNLEYFRDELIAFCTRTPGPWLAHWAPHHPHAVTETGELTPLPAHATRWSSYVHPVDVDEDLTGKPAWVQALPKLTHAQVARIQESARQQARVLSGVDDAIAAVVGALDGAGVLDDTVIIFSSDQGVHYGEHRWGHYQQGRFDVPPAVQKQTPYEPTVRIPLLASGPGFPPGRISVPVSQPDITATAVAIAGAHPSHELDGIDLRAIAAEPEAHADRVVLFGARTAFTLTPSWDGVFTGPDHPSLPSRKFWRHVTGEYEHYDLAADPGELVNLHGVDPATDAALEALLDAALA